LVTGLKVRGLVLRGPKPRVTKPGYPPYPPGSRFPGGPRFTRFPDRGVPGKETGDPKKPGYPVYPPPGKGFTPRGFTPGGFYPGGGLPPRGGYPPRGG